MRYVAAYLLAVLGGKESPSTNDIKNILDKVGVSVEDEPLKRVVDQLSGKNIDDLVAEGQAMLSSVPTGGVAAAGGGGGAAAGGDDAGGAAEKAEEKKEEPEEEESDDDMGFGLFD